jgi:hypothetical protein
LSLLLCLGVHGHGQEERLNRRESLWNNCQESRVAEDGVTDGISTRYIQKRT